MHITEEKLKDMLSKSGMVEEEAFASAKKEALRFDQTIPNVLIGRGDITEKFLVELLEPYFGAPIIDLKKVTISTEVLELIPETYAKSKDVIIFEYDKEKRIVKAAMLDPLDYDTIEFLRAKLSAWIEVHLTTPASLKYGLKQYKKEFGVKFSQVISLNVKEFLAVGDTTDLNKMAEAVPIITILNSIIDNAVDSNASDIHFEPMKKNVLVRYRIDGILHEILNLHKLIEPILVARVKVLANLQIDEHRLPQDGRFRFDIDTGNAVDVRVNVMPMMHGEKVEMRLLKSSARPLTLEELGIASDIVPIVLEEIKKPHGMILVTGPTGHGKTTTLYAILHILNTPKVNITTIEDPIEYEIPRINQTQVNTKSGITFANGLRSILRQNPDIIMVGEIRDNDTVDIAVHAALTGHLVLSSLHTNDAPAALPRLLDMGAAAFLLASTVNLVIAQRLIRKLCNSCIESYRISPEIKRLITAQINLTDDTHIRKIPETLFESKGCKACGDSGFQGQIGIFEVLRITESIKTLLMKHTSAGEMRRQAIKEGMVTMFEDGLKKAEKGITSIEEVLRVVRE